MKLIALLALVLSLPAHAASLRLDGAEYVGIIQTPGQSCASQVNHGKNSAFDLEGAKALVGTLALSWSGPGELTLESLEFIFSGKEFPGGEQRALVTGSELGYLWQGVDEPAVFSARESRSSSPFCFLQLGGLKVVDPYEYFEKVGTIRAVGTYVEGGARQSVTTELPFRFHYNPVLRK